MARIPSAVLGIESSTLPFPLSNELLHSMNKLSVLLGNILLPQRHSEETYEYNENLHEILDHLQFAVLIVDKETYRPVYYNRFLGQLVGDSVPDIPCYKVFWKKDAPLRGLPHPSPLAHRSGISFRLHRAARAAGLLSGLQSPHPYEGRSRQGAHRHQLPRSDNRKTAPSSQKASVLAERWLFFWMPRHGHRRRPGKSLRGRTHGKLMRIRYELR
jgi:hypothetical protein